MERGQTARELCTSSSTVDDVMIKLAQCELPLKEIVTTWKTYGELLKKLCADHVPMTVLRGVNVIPCSSPRVARALAMKKCREGLSVIIIE